MKSFLFLLLLLPICTFAQKLQTVVDKLNGTTTYQTSSEKIYFKSGFGQAGEVLNVSVSKTNNTYLLTFIPISGTIDLTAIDSTKNTYIKFTNGSIDTLHLVNAKILNYEPGNFYRMMLNYYLTDDQLKDLKNNPIAFVRIQTNDRNDDFDIDEKKSGLLQKSIALLP